MEDKSSPRFNLALQTEITIFTPREMALIFPNFSHHQAYNLSLPPSIHCSLENQVFDISMLPRSSGGTWSPVSAKRCCRHGWSYLAAAQSYLSEQTDVWIADLQLAVPLNLHGFLQQQEGRLSGSKEEQLIHLGCDWIQRICFEVGKHISAGQ